MGEQAGDREESHPGTLTLACTKGLTRLSSPHLSLRRHWKQTQHTAGAWQICAVPVITTPGVLEARLSLVLDINQ